MSTPTRSSVTGNSIIAGEYVRGEDGHTKAVNPATGEELDPSYGLVSISQLETATKAAQSAFDVYRSTSPQERGAFLERIARNIEALGSVLIDRAVAETGLRSGRIEGELARTTGQLRLFAEVVKQGDHVQARIDPALPDRAPLPRQDIRQQHIGLGPVAVFGASNFPLAFSTAGGDTASALAAGCPVIVKAHNAHPGTAELVGQAVSRAVTDSNLPAGVFSILFGAGKTVGQALVADPRIKAVGFTGSRSGGVSLMKTAANRSEPIPVYAEMSSINPVFIFEAALKGNQNKLSADFIASLTMGSGQFCTNPGLIFIPKGKDGDSFVQKAATALGAATGTTMLSSGIAQACAAGIQHLRETPGVLPVGEGQTGTTLNAPAPALFTTSVETFMSSPALQEEVFGAAGLIVRYQDEDELLKAAEELQGQLTATVHCPSDSAAGTRQLITVLERKVGRILFNSWPTGVEVGHAIVHGGPFPATSDSRSTSVGTLAIHRFQRPVSYQNVPQQVLPALLHDRNPLKLNRRLNGVVQTPAE
jgi:alpha-ketoglutaric semialdehyde dehydrogenase